MKIYRLLSSLSVLTSTLAWAVSLPAAPPALEDSDSPDRQAGPSAEAELSGLRDRIERPEAARDRRSDSASGGGRVAVQEATEVVEDPGGVTVGGALRFNYFVKDYDEDVKTRRGDAGLDIFRINADGEFGDLYLSAEYRFYSYMDAIHHGYVGYRLAEGSEIQGGITRVPFGLLPYAAHNFWFGVPYYTGLSDDYDLGLKYVRKRGPWDLQLAFFKNEELGDASDLERYAYDPVTAGSARNEETNTVNARAAYSLDAGGCVHEVGLSGQRGELFNVDTAETGEHWAAAPHLDSRCGRWNMQLEAARYGYDARNPSGTGGDAITFGGFAAIHDVAANGTIYVANVAYNVPLPWPRVQLLTCYNDYSRLDKETAGFDDSELNTTGCLLNIGPTYTYVDVIQGRNMVFLGDGSLAGGGSDEWHTRFNVNFGVYW